MQASHQCNARPTHHGRNSRGMQQGGDTTARCNNFRRSSGKSCQRSICKFSTKTVLQVWQTRAFQEGLPTNYKQCRLIRSLFGMREKETSSCKKQCKWRNSVGKLQEERGLSTRDDTSDGDDSRASSARGTIIGEQHSDTLSRTICRIPSDPELLPPGAQCDLATSKVICFLDDNYAVIPTGVTGSSWKRQDFLIIGKDRSSVLGLVIYPSVISADRNDELTVLAKPHQPPLIIPPNTSIARAIALPPHAAEQVLPVLREQDPPSGIGGNTLCLQSEDAIVVSGPGGKTAIIHPFVVQRPITVWGRDILVQWGVRLEVDF
ncbi:uncharacterized protein LOC120764912 [Hirundo rustica]|uniref:uncharacterized protein LOC120764912 n=1 Tax=Hirundo rustica TaxID=43150 RepID=UPI001A94A708|nr:uncharacterized protein LOC120764912 [Hirundo rustica]